MRHHSVFLLGTMLVLAAANAGWSGYTESNRETVTADLGKQASMDESGDIPIIPETTAWLLGNSDIIAYSYIDKLEGGIEKAAPGHTCLDVMSIYPEQHCAATLLWILKGDETWEGKTISFSKKRSRYVIYAKEKRVLYLKREGVHFYTIDRFGGEPRLASALCDIRNLKRNGGIGGIVASFQGEDTGSRPTIHVLKGRQKASLRINDPAWKRSFLRSAPIGPFDVCEISLGGGTYTVLMEIEGDLVSHTRLIDGWYATVNVGEYRWWEPLYFTL